MTKTPEEKQFIYNEEKDIVECRCGHPAIKMQGGYVCGTITAYPCEYVRQSSVVQQSLTSEERARAEAEAMISEYASNSHISREYYIEGYLSGYHSRNEEVKELREALKECIENIECIEANVNHSEGFFSALMNATVFCEQAKQLLNKE